ncbi:nuclear pore complex protein NUP96 [Salvia divinorum]|uniref:Nuclear pore complex protein NUP96 n=1 Tax=Salvia divinorum TaxID=28513 RepID=A0ABD1H5Q7_SALDI
MGVDLAVLKPTSIHESQYKRRRVSLSGADTSLSCQVLHDAENSLPTLCCSDYYTKPCLSELAIRELSNPGYCSRVEDFVIGRFGYGCVKFIGETDVRRLDLDSIVKFRKCEIVIYEDDSSKPLVGHGLNKPAEVTLLLQTKPLSNLNEEKLAKIVEKLKCKTESQGAHFISFNPDNREWKFLVQHFSRFGLGEEDEDDVPMDEMSPGAQDPEGMNGSEVSDDEDNVSPNMSLLSHSLPAHLGLDPVRMKDMRMLWFPSKEDEVEALTSRHPYDNPPFAKDSSRSPLHHSSRKAVHNSNAPSIRKTPLALKEFNPGGFSSTSSGAILLSQQNKGLHLTTGKSEGFELELTKKTPVTGSHSCNIVDAALFMGRSFRVGWGPNGILVHSGMPVGSYNSRAVLSSVINIEKVALDKVTRDDNNKVKEELTDFCFSSPLSIHKELSRETKKVELGTFNLKLQKLICDRLTLSDICRSYIDIIEKQLEVPSISSDTRVLLMHQVLVWELIKVLFSSRKMGGQLKLIEEEDEEDMIPDARESYPDVDQEALPLIRRAAFSYWLQESVHHRVQDDISLLNELSGLEHIFLLLSGRQMDAAVELAASRGDVRLSCLLSQAGGSTTNRADIAHQLDLWRKNGLDFSFIEDDRVRLLELLAGNIHRALHGVKIDWKRFLGLLMWYKLPPDISLPVVFNTYQKLLNEGDAPYPVPVYIDEGPIEDVSKWVLNNRFDLAYYLMLLHAREENDFGALKTMFSASASTYDPLDYHMIWHQRAVLEAIGTFSSNDLHVLDMAYVSQLLCLGQCHWAIYVVLHMPHREDYPYLQATVIREILFQYCEVWSTHDSQWEFIESLGIPLAWLHEALAIFHSYTGDLPKALGHFLACASWQKAHTVFLTSVAPSLFLSAKHTEIWGLATSMEDHKSVIEDWDLGAGIYISFYILKNSMQEDNNTMTELDTLENKNDACADFISRLNKSLAVRGNKLSVEARVVFSKMAEEISSLLLSDSDEVSTGEDQLICFETVFRAPMPEDLRSYHLQDAVSLFTCHLSELAQ